MAINLSGINLGGCGGTIGGGNTGGGAVDAYTKAQSDAKYAQKSNLTELDLKVGKLAAAVGAANEELNAI